MTLLRLLLLGTVCGDLVAPRFAAAQGQRPEALVITAHNVTAEAAGARENGAVAKPGDVIRYVLVFTNVTAGLVKNIQFVGPLFAAPVPNCNDHSLLMVSRFPCGSKS